MSWKPKGMFVGVDKASNLSKSFTVQQIITVKPDGCLQIYSSGIHSSGIHPITPFRVTKMTATPQNVKQNKFTIVTIMMKTIAGELRDKYSDLYIEAHPQSRKDTARLLVRRVKTDEKIIIDLRPGSVNSSRQPWLLNDQQNTNQYSAFPSFYRKNRVSRKNGPQAFSFALDDPKGTISFEKWIDELVTNWFYADSQPNTNLRSDTAL